MMNDIEIDFFKSLLEKSKTKGSRIFPKKLAAQNEEIRPNSYSIFNRILSDEEKEIFTQESFNELIKFIDNNQIDLTFFEKFMSAAVFSLGKLNKKIDTNTAITMIELIGATGFEETSITTTFRMYIENPKLINNLNSTIH
ncbi:MAG: hypothetical protein PHY08_04825 [Candidatus Cloacimonetes bacterium]|jgi:hypothetical protein|nr:hypothetical protein [Candidatus Cloacimonadota bacterium]MDD4155878.1 hypothetical protein [Candidatus Cloacimonadota bacterium]